MATYTRFCIAVLLLTGLHIHAQDLPRYMTEEERSLVESGEYQFPVLSNASNSRMPVISPRSIGEWEELQAVAVTWTQYKGILAEIIEHSAKEVEVIIVARDTAQARSELASYGVNADSNIVYIASDYNSVWMRDYGPNPAYLGNVDTLVLVDWIYNRPRPKDDVVPEAIADYMGVPLLSTTTPPNDLVNTGGNYMTDGLGRAFSSELVINENGPGNIWGVSNHDAAAIDQIMWEFLGIEEYVKMPVLPYDGIHHIDMHMKLLDEGRLLVGEYPENIADGPQIEANIQYVLENFKVATGRDYEVIRVPMPPDQFDRYPHQGGYYRTYANALFVNNTILVPTYEERYDTTALRIWRESMPGYKVVGINCNQMIPAGGAIHCITKEIGTRDPLWIAHESPLRMEYEPVIMLEAHAEHRSGVERVTLFYNRNGLGLDSVEMTSDNALDWTAQLSGVQPLDTIHYFFKGHSVDGKSITRPLVAPEGTFRLVIGTGTSSAFDAEMVVSDVMVYPNPASGITCVQFEISAPGEGVVEIFNADGRLISRRQTDRFKTGINKKFFDASELVPGTYFIRIQCDTGVVVKKIISH